MSQLANKVVSTQQAAKVISLFIYHLSKIMAWMLFLSYGN